MLGLAKLNEAGTKVTKVDHTDIEKSPSVVAYRLGQVEEAVQGLVSKIDSIFGERSVFVSRQEFELRRQDIERWVARVETRQEKQESNTRTLRLLLLGSLVCPVIVGIIVGVTVYTLTH